MAKEREIRQDRLPPLQSGRLRERLAILELNPNQLDSVVSAVDEAMLDEYRELTEARRKVLEDMNRSSQLASIKNGLLLGFGLIAFCGMAYLFRSSVLASIPLIAMGALVVFWIPFQKFNQLRRVEAEFGSSGVRVGASSQVDKAADMLSTLQQEKIKLEIRAVQKNIELLDAQAAERTDARTLGS